MDGNLKKKTYNEDQFIVINHENGTIYNDVVHFDKTKLDDALKNYNNYPKQDSSLIVRGNDGLILRKKGDEQYVAQSLAYLYNDFESGGKLESTPYTNLLAPEFQ